MRIKLRLAGIFLGMLILVPETRADFYTHFWENRFPKSTYSLGMITSYFITTSNFSNAGILTTPSGLGTYGRFLDDVDFNLRFSNQFGFFARANWSYTKINSTGGATTGFGFGDQTLGLALRIFGQSPDSLLSIDLQGQADLPGYNNSVSTAKSTPYLGDGSIDLTGGIFATFVIAEGRKYKFQTLMGAGFTYRSQYYSQALPWSVLLKLTPQINGFSCELGAMGFLSLQNDANLTAHTLLSSGGSYFTGANNPSLLQGNVKLGYKFEPNSQLDLFSRLNLWGENAPAGYSVGLQFQIFFGKLKQGHIEKQLVALEPTESDASTNEVDENFTTYSLSSTIVKTNDRLNLVKINKGSQDGIEAGQIFDVFNVKVESKNGEIIARALVTSVKPDEAALEITEYYKEVPIEDGFIVKRLIR